MASNIGPRPVGTSLLVLLLLGLGPVAGLAQDRIGVYWDESLARTDTTSLALGQLTGYLVIREPSSGGGILGWECHVDIDGPAVATSWQVAGQAINAESPPRFAVGLAAPLPPATDTVVATFGVVILEVAPVTVALKPLFFASLPGEMAYLGADAPSTLTALSTVSGEEIVATVNRDAFVGEVDVLSVNFGELPLGLGRGTANVRVSNTGGGILPVDLSLVGGEFGFAMGTPPGPLGVEAGQSLTIGLSFEPTGLGQVSGSLQLGPHLPAVALFGSGREPIPAWTVPGDVDFGRVPVATVQSRNVSLRNTGETPLNLSVDWVDACAAFTIASGSGPVVLVPGQTFTVQINFFPTEAGTFACDLGFGVGLPTVTVSADSYVPAPSYTLNTSYVSFPGTEPGRTRSQLVRITNTGSYGFALDPQLVPPHPVFALGPKARQLTLGPGSTWSFYVHFTALTAGFFTTDLALGDLLPSIHLEARGGTNLEFCSVNPETVEFQVNAVGESQSRTFTVVNPGPGLLELEPSVDSFAYAVQFVSTTLSPGQSAVVQVNFQPGQAGITNGTLLLGPGACYPVALHGIVGPDLAAGENEIGLYFDPAFQTTVTGPGDGPTSIPVYLALTNPTDLTGVAQWECRVANTGLALFSDWTLAGGGVNVANPADPNEFNVGTGLVPLPALPQGILLAAGQLQILDTDPDNVTLQLFPRAQPSLAGLMSWTAAGNLGQLQPLQTSSGQPTVARIDSASPVADDLLPVARRTALQPNVPNPFNPRTRIAYDLAVAGQVRVTIYDSSGRLVRTLVDTAQEAGRRSVFWHGLDNAGQRVASGSYHVRLQAGGVTDHRKILLLK